MKVLIVDDEKTLRFALTELFTHAGYQVYSSSDGEEALQKLENQSIDIVILDYHLPGLNGLELLSIIKENYQWIQVILITAFGSEQVAIDAIKKGAYDYISKPFNNEALLNRINHIRSSREQMDESTDSRFGYYFSPVMSTMIDKIKTIARTEIPLLITGESGTGKELIARICHHHSERQGNFISVNCSALPQTLIESELFGSEKGAFTGSIGKKVGFFELAHNGTIFLDEIGEMPFEMQAKILRVLQEGEIQRLGGGLPIKINSRVIAATNRNLEEEIAKGNFREDLYYRLNVIQLKIPSLRFRKEEIQPLTLAFLKEFNKKYEKQIQGFDENSLAQLQNHTWPGNIRELKNKIEQAVLFCNNDWISASDLSLSDEIMDKKEKSNIENDQQATETLKKTNTASSPVQPTNQNEKLLISISQFPDQITQAKKEAIDIFEKEFILHYLNKNQWNVKNTASQIGLCRQDLYKKMKKLGIQKEVKYV
ncbi:MAG: sigma-54 dependent transcriptional regulator [Spirochaetes bacterium]|nr:sigma-54 dependent transcriptional regulator [Spirochaetota bacterium]